MSENPYSQTAFKRSILHFLSGKAVSALLTFVTLLWLVRLLPVPEYAAYVTLVATLEVTLILCSLGLPWLAVRYLPDFRLHAPRSRFVLLVKRLLAWQIAIFLFASLLLLLLIGIGLDALGLAAYSRAVTIYLAMVVVDGIGRMVRESLLTALLQQGLAQISLATRNATLLILLAAFAFHGDVHIEDVVIVDLTAAMIGAVLAILGLRRHVKSITAAAGDSTWREPSLLQMLAVAGHMYSSLLISLTYNPQVFLVIISSKLSVELVAAFGFLRSLYLQVSRYLPAFLLSNLIHPKMVADFTRTQETANLSGNVNLAGKISLFVLMPLIVIVAVAGDSLIALLSGGKFPQAGAYFLGLLIGLIPFSKRQLLETAAVATGNGNLCLRASMSGLLILPLMLLLLAAGMGLWAPVVAMVTGNFLFNIVIQFGLKRRIQYAADHAGWIRILAITALAYLGTSVLAPTSQSPSTLLVAVCLTGFFYLAAGWWIKPFSENERNGINAFLGKRVFRW